MNPGYQKLLNDPRWIKKRTKIFKRDKYQCTVCGSKNNLECHHTFYYKNYRKPWLYPNNSLLTLCNKCHREYHLYNEIEIKNVPKKKKQKPKIKKKKQNKRMRLIPHRNLIKVKHGKGFIYKLETIFTTE